MLTVKVFADGADLEGIRALKEIPVVQGFTTNPTLMKQAGVADYLEFAREMLDVIEGLPVSFEVLSDDFREMVRQAKILSGLAPNVSVKVPITDTNGKATSEVIRELALEGASLNVTAMFTRRHVERSVIDLEGSRSSYLSIFAGRIADTGVDPIPVMREALEIMRPHGQLELIWASPREVLNIIQASDIGCHVITVTHDLLRKLSIIGKNLDEYSLDTVRMFAQDAAEVGYVLG